MFRYEIDSNNTVTIYADGDAPVLVQDLNPLGAAWKSKAEAKAWAEAYLDGIDDRIAEGIAHLEALNAEADAQAVEPEPEPEPEK